MPFTSDVRRAFSLVELSIVLVILGLLVGGVLSGQSLIRAAELRSVTTQITQYTPAAQSFRDKYFALPGDMTNAISFWTADAAGCPNGGGSTGVCNGDGNGQVATVPGNTCENQEFWRHLARAGLIEGSYTTVVAANCFGPATFGTHAPATKLSNVGAMLSFTGNIVTGATFPNTLLYPGSYGNAFYIGTRGVNHLTAAAAFKTEEAWNIDTKMDDGKPDSGIVSSILLGIFNSGCATSATPGVAAYALNASGSLCALVVKSGF